MNEDLESLPPRPESGRFSGKRAFVSGGGSGIGRAIVHRLVAEGIAAITIADVRSDRVDQVRGELNGTSTLVVPLTADLGDPGSARAGIEKATAEMGGLDILIANHAMVSSGTFLTETVENWNRVFEVNTASYFVLAQTAARQMIAAGRGGAILFTGAAVERGGATGHGIAYGSSKWAVLGMVKGMAVMLAPHRIRVCAVSPGAVDTNLAIDAVGEEAGNRAKAGAAAGLAIGRMARPDELAAMYAFLASDEASYVSGSNHWVDGGWMGPSQPS